MTRLKPAEPVNGDSNRTALQSGDAAVPSADLRMLMYSHDTFGLGHLQRCLKLSRALTAAMPDLSILIVTGSSVVHRFELPARVDYVKLPAVRKIGPERYEARSLNTPYESIAALRRSLLLTTVQQFQPHIVLVDHSPTGMKGEMLPALEWLGTGSRRCVRILGLRDIIDDPIAVRALWNEQGTYELLEKHYDTILIYGPQEIFDSAQAYGMSEVLCTRIHYCGYIGESEMHVRSEEAGSTPAPKSVVVTIGGGDGATEVVSTYLEMIRRFRERVDFESHVVTGPFVDDETFARIERLAHTLGVRLDRFVPSTSPLFAQSDLVIATGGYNTMTQILGHARRALVIPRVLYREEQLLRATLLARAGWIQMMPPEELTPECLFDQVISLLSDSHESVTEARKRRPDLLTGAQNVVRIIAASLHEFMSNPGVRHNQ